MLIGLPNSPAIQVNPDDTLTPFKVLDLKASIVKNNNMDVGWITVTRN